MPNNNARDLVSKVSWTLAKPLPRILLLVLFVLLVAGCAQAQSPASDGNGDSKKQPQKQTSESSSGQGDVGKTAAGGSKAGGELEHPALGEKNAPVVMVEYSDYQ